MNKLLGVLAIIIGLVGYVPYFKTMLSGKTKPHAFTWLVWGVLTAIAFFGQVAGNGGAGAWVTGFTACISFIIFIYALFKGTKDFPLADWLCLLGSGFAMLLWAVTDSPLSAIVIITIVDLLAFIPTFRKSYQDPHTEPASTYILSGIKFLLAIFALTEFSIVTVLYPASLVVTNLLFVALLYIRRNKL